MEKLLHLVGDLTELHARKLGTFIAISSA